ncbi:hypothetical protein GCM10007100_30980 [Roseibacillus persicicus]|uniref:TIGR03749 family integrating conjugative element protein n=1 Tax=Roseibacillus persicicus TaxID=454148 RepID=A0A918WL34_9BACT|nr:hypothetical protein GCM10007100_30980 [Roseibacillus persicicus]
MGTSVKALLALASLFLTVLPLAAQESQPVRSIRVLCLGDPPPFVQEVRNGIRYEVDPPKGSVPPPRVNIRGIQVESGQPSLSLRLRLASKRHTYVAGEEAVLILENPDGSEWLRAPLPQFQKSMLVLWRDKSGTWEEPRHLFVSDEVPSGSVRVHNFSGSMKGIVFGAQKLKVAPGKATKLQFPDGASRADFALLYQQADQSLRPFHTTSLMADDSLEQQFFIYAADVKDSRMPFKVVTLTEPKVVRSES